MFLITRNEPISHPMLSRLLNPSLSERVIERKFFNKIYITQCSGPQTLVVFDDPFSFLYGLFFFPLKGRHLRLWALELWSGQVAISTLRTFFRYLIFKFAEILAYYFANSIVFPSKMRLKLISKAYFFLPLAAKSSVVFNIPEFMEVGDELDLSLQQKLQEFRSSVKKIVIYAGSLQQGRLIEELVFKVRWSTNVGLLICGGGSLASEIKYAEKLNKNICFLGSINKNALASVYSVVDFGILCYSNEVLNTRFCAPVKLWEYLHYGLRIIGNNNQALKNEWKPYIDGIYLNVEEILNIVERLESLKQKPRMPKFDFEKLKGLF